jgi:hypothetical protein
VGAGLLIGMVERKTNYRFEIQSTRKLKTKAWQCSKHNRECGDPDYN